MKPTAVLKRKYAISLFPAFPPPKNPKDTGCFRFSAARNSLSHPPRVSFFTHPFFSVHKRLFPRNSPPRALVSVLCFFFPICDTSRKKCMFPPLSTPSSKTSFRSPCFPFISNTTMNVFRELTSRVPPRIEQAVFFFPLFSRSRSFLNTAVSIFYIIRCVSRDLRTFFSSGPLLSVSQITWTPLSFF